MKEITLKFPAELLKALEDAAKAEKVSLAEWIQARIIGRIAQETAYAEVFGKAPPTLRMDFVRDEEGRLLEGDNLHLALLAVYKELYIQSKQGEGEKPPTWH